MNSMKTLLGGLGLGAGLMYLFDPGRGNRRRALLRDQVIHLMNKTGDAVEVTSTDLSNRTQGLIAEMSHLFETGPISDPVLEARIRERLGFLVSHPGSIHVMVENGHVVLSGPILDYEVDKLLAAVAKMRGVQTVENQLEVHERPYDVPGLQGRPATPKGGTFELMQENWSPTARFLVGATGAALALIGARSRSLFGALFSTAGLGLVARALTNKPMKRIVGMGAGRRAVDIQKTININAPVETVYRFWSNFENFPRFMSNIKEVRRTGDVTSHWVVEGPAGIPVEWDAKITKMIPNEELAWKTLEGQPVAHAGIIHFRRNEDGGTRVDIKLSYNPPAGTVGHIVASLFGADPKSEMDADLVRMKSLIEEGKTTANGEEVTRMEIAATE